MKILICGLPGTGKTTLAQELRRLLISKLKTAAWYNADTIRQMHNDWDFSPEGRIRQAKRMKHLADTVMTDYVICDFVAPTEEIRQIFDADYTVWMNTEIKSEYEDTNLVFEEPTHSDFIVLNKDAETICKTILKDILEQTSPQS